MLNNIVLRQRKVSHFRHGFDTNIRVDFLPVDQLLERAQRITQSCIHLDQLSVSRDFFKGVAARGFYHKRYTREDTHKLEIIVDYIVHTRGQELTTADAM